MLSIKSIQMKKLFILSSVLLACACTEWKGGGDEQVELSWGSVELCMENPVAPSAAECYQIKVKVDTLAGEGDLARSLAAVVRDSILCTQSSTMQEAVKHLVDSIEADWKVELAERYDPESEYKDIFQYYYSVEAGPVEKEQDGILSYQAITDTYLGGAHGSHYVQYFNFDVQSGKLLTISDVVPADKEMLVLMAMEERLCKDWEAKDLADLQEKTGITMLGNLYLTNNFLLRGDSIVFLFNQYEIAPYAAGLISVTLAKP
jgi:hypothetical protein